MINLKRSNVSGYRLLLNCSKNYDIMVTAWNQQGHNHYSEKSLESIRTERGNDSVLLLFFLMCFVLKIMISKNHKYHQSFSGSLTQYEIFFYSPRLLPSFQQIFWYTFQYFCLVRGKIKSVYSKNTKHAL